MRLSQKIKHLWHKANTHLPLKEWARQNLTEEITTWFLNKGGAPQKAQRQERLEKKGPLLAIIGQASKNARRK